MDSTNINRIKTTQASFTGKTQDIAKKSENQNTIKDTISQQAEKKEQLEKENLKAQQQEQQLKQDQIRKSQLSNLNLLRNKAQTQQKENVPLYKQELQSLKGVLKDWLSSMLNPNSNFGLMNKLKADENTTQRFVMTWLNADNKAIENLEKILNTQLIMNPQNAEIFVKLQLVKLVKDAKKMVEDFNDNRLKDVPKGEAEENQFSSIAAGMMATAMNKLKKKKKKDYTDIREELKNELKSRGISDINEKPYYENISRARKLLKEAEKELYDAIKNGADQETINKIIEKIADLFSLLAELYTSK
ncbi:MAG: hypothetical protein N2485_02335 [bacterium]|nr:hypothetical protein [bacterium]